MCVRSSIYSHQNDTKLVYTCHVSEYNWYYVWSNWPKFYTRQAFFRDAILFYVNQDKSVENVFNLFYFILLSVFLHQQLHFPLEWYIPYFSLNKWIKSAAALLSYTKTVFFFLRSNLPFLRWDFWITLGTICKIYELNYTLTRWIPT